MVIWSEPAKDDLRSIHDFIAHDSKYYAKKVAQDIREKADILERLPRMGKKVPELVGEENTHELALYSYRIIYEVKTDDLVEVLAVIHKRQDFTAEDLS